VGAPKHTLDQLVVLETIDRTGSFAAAARELHRVPSAISYAVKALEEAVGVALFDRAGHRATLTPAGRRLLEEGGRVLAAARGLDRLAEELQAGWEPEVAVVVDGALPTEPVMAALAAFTGRGLPTRVQVNVEYQGGVWERFADLAADLAMPLEDAESRPEASEPLPVLPFAVLAAAGHPLAGRPLERAELDAHVELVVKDSSAVYARRPREAWFGSRHAVHLSDFHAKRLALLQGAGYGWMPLHLVRADLASGALVPLELGDAGAWEYRPHLVRRPALGPAGELFATLLCESFGSTD
jgi:DNA-binding transcriptional LysR family regulator